MKFVLQLGQRDIELPPGRFIIGRAEDAQFALEDALVSRHHAAIDVKSDTATLLDLESRNGVRLNGKKLDAPQKLSPGDRIAIGPAEFVFALARRDPAKQMLAQATTQRLTAFGLFGALADKAFALGRADEAERLLAPQIEHLLADVQGGKKYDPASVERACVYALRIAEATNNPAWLGTVFRFYAAMGQLCPSSMVDDLYAVAHKVKPPNVEELRSYLGVLRQNLEALGPADRFLIGRLEGLERALG